MISACLGEAVDRPPVWLMRQAGRYLPEYLELRARHRFWKILRDPELAVEATLQPLRRFDVDAAILFSDILVVLEAMGAGVSYQTGGPVIERPVRSAADLGQCRAVRVSDDLAYVGEAMMLLREDLPRELAIIGFAGAPLTLAAYLVEGGPSRDLRHLKALAYRDPGLADAILSHLTEVVEELLILQVQAGADLVQLFDSWAVYLSPEDYQLLALPYIRRIREHLKDAGVPAILYLRGAASHLGSAASAGYDMISVDQSIGLADARARLGPNVGLQGNLDPAELLGPPERIRSQVRRMIAAAGPTRYVVNLGQGLVPDIPVKGVAAFVDAVHEA